MHRIRALLPRSRFLLVSSAVLLACCAVSVAFTPGTGSADCAGTHFAGQVRSAAVIFAGTLDQIRVEHSTEFAGSISLLRFRRIAYAKGDGPPESLAVTQPGVVGLMADWPSYEQGMRYVAFATRAEAKGRRSSAPPLVATSCTSFHPFTVRADSAGREVVRDDLGRPVVGATRDRIVLLARRSWDPTWPWVERDSTGAPIKPRLAGNWKDGSFEVRVLWPEDDPGTRVGEADLLAWLRSIADGVAAAPDSSRRE
jgi:hypothetical protein